MSNDDFPRGDAPLPVEPPAPDATPPLETLLRYMRESYVAVAPKKLGRSLSSPPGAP